MQREIDLELQLHAYVDGDLDEEAMDRVEDYLRKNPEMAARVRDYLRQKDDIRGFASNEAYAGESPAIQELGRKLARRLRPPRASRWRRPIMVTVLLAVGWLGHALFEPLVEGPHFVAGAVQAHLLSTADPSEVPPISPERLSRLFARIGEAERLPDLRQFGYEAVGMQLLPGEDGPFLHVPYRGADGSTMSYFLFHEDSPDEVPRHVLHRQGVTMVYWQHEQSRYAIAAPLPDETLASIAAFLDTPTSSL